MQITKSGIYKDFPEEEYYADPCPTPSLSQTIAKILIEQSPAHARIVHPRLRDGEEHEPEKYGAARVIGIAAHKLFLGRGRDLELLDCSDFKTAAAREALEDATADGKVGILAHHFATAKSMAIAAKAQLEETSAFTTLGDTEVMIAAEIDGCWYRSLVDSLKGNIVLDYKTTGKSVAPHAVSQLMADAGWPIQAAMQEKILREVVPNNNGYFNFVFVAQENYPPYALTVNMLSEGSMHMGRKMLAHADTIWRECIAHNLWPRYPTGINYPEFPGWKESQWLNRELEAAYSDGKRAGAMVTNLAGG